MYSKILYIALLIVAIVLAYQCSTSLHVPTMVDAQKNGTSLDTLVKGREIYIRSCGSCHSLYLPEKYTAVQWNKEMSRMQKPAKINNEQKELILKYLTSKSRD